MGDLIGPNPTNVGGPIMETVEFLSRQGIALGGHKETKDEQNDHVSQVLLLRGRKDVSLQENFS